MRLSYIVLLCANGWTTGAMKILRGMFERAVIACYLQKHVEERDLFWDFWPVSRRRAARRVNEDMPDALPESVLLGIEREYDAVKEKYRITDCRKCKTTRVNYTWSQKDLIAMAKVETFEVAIHFGYYTPMTETHASVGAVLRRINFNEADNSFYYESGTKPQDESQTLIVANYLLLRALGAFHAEFNVQQLEAALDRCGSDYVQRLKGEENQLGDSASKE